MMRDRDAPTAGLKDPGEREPGLSQRLRAYALLRILPLPLAVPAFAIGLGSESRVAIGIGFSLLALWLIDTAVVMPVVLAREGRARRRRDTA